MRDMETAVLVFAPILNSVADDVIEIRLNQIQYGKVGLVFGTLEEHRKCSSDSNCNELILAEL
jgi:hypothetical protein